MNELDSLFEDQPVLAVPARAEAYQSKVPGTCDSGNQAEWCG